MQGKYLEVVAKKRTSQALTKLMDVQVGATWNLGAACSTLLACLARPWPALCLSVSFMPYDLCH